MLSNSCGSSSTANSSMFVILPLVCQHTLYLLLVCYELFRLVRYIFTSKMVCREQLCEQTRLCLMCCKVSLPPWLSTIMNHIFESCSYL